MLCCIRAAASAVEHIECVGGNGVDVDAAATAALTKRKSLVQVVLK